MCVIAGSPKVNNGQLANASRTASAVAQDRRSRNWISSNAEVADSSISTNENLSDCGSQVAHNCRIPGHAFPNGERDSILHNSAGARVSVEEKHESPFVPLRRSDP